MRIEYIKSIGKLDRQTGAVIWRLGGKKTDFTLGPGVQFAWQHNPIAVDASTIRIFDNESNGTPGLPYSRVIWVQHDDVNKTATLVRSIEHPAALSAASQGNSEALDNGDTFVGWGALGRISEFDPYGNLLFDASVPAGQDTYRGYRYDWHPDLHDKPTATVQVQSDGSTLVHAIWNGATDIATWEIVDSSKHGGQKILTSSPWNGLDTAITVGGPVSSVRVVALDLHGNELGTSPAATVTR